MYWIAFRHNLLQGVCGSRKNQLGPGQCPGDEIRSPPLPEQKELSEFTDANKWLIRICIAYLEWLS
jgi:hypothetical protein